MVKKMKRKICGFVGWWFEEWRMKSVEWIEKEVSRNGESCERIKRWGKGMKWRSEEEDERWKIYEIWKCGEWMKGERKMGE